MGVSCSSMAAQQVDKKVGMLPRPPAKLFARLAARSTASTSSSLQGEEEEWEEIMAQGHKDVYPLSHRLVIMTPPKEELAALRDGSVSSRPRAGSKEMPSRPRTNSKEMYEMAISTAAKLVKAKSLHSMLHEDEQESSSSKSILKSKRTSMRRQERLYAIEFIACNQHLKDTVDTVTKPDEAATISTSALQITFIMQRFIVDDAPKRLDVSLVSDEQRQGLVNAWEANDHHAVYRMLQFLVCGQDFTDLANSFEFKEFIEKELAGLVHHPRTGSKVKFVRPDASDVVAAFF